MNAREFAQILFRRKHLVLAGVLAGLAGGPMAAHGPPTLRVEATLLAEAGRPDAARALAAVLDSRDLRRRLIEALGPRLYPGLDPGRAQDRLAGDLAISPEDGAALVRVRLDNPDGAAALAALAMLLAEVRDGAGLLDAARLRPLLLEQRTRLQAEAEAARAEESALSDTLAMLRGRLADTPATIRLESQNEPSRVLEDARAKLFELETQEQEMLGRYREESPLVARLRAERRRVEAVVRDHDRPLEARTREGSNPVRQDLEREVFKTEAGLAAARARAKALAGNLGETEARLSGLSGLGLSGLGEPGGSVSVVEGEDARPRPVGPDPPTLAALSALLGLALGLVAAFAAERLSDCLATPSDVERRLGLAVLTSIPREG